MPKTRHSYLRTISRVAVLLALCASAYAGWTWLDGCTVQRVVVDGHRHAAPEAVLEIARIDSGGRLLDVDPAVIADRARRHPWVASASVRRLPPGTVQIDVKERTPVALVLSASGAPVAYLDREGYAMPMVEGAVYDVPLLRGARLSANDTQPLASSAVLDLLRVLEDIPPDLDALVASFDIDAAGDILLHTAPGGAHSSMVVRLGRGGYAEKFGRLKAFWTQAVLSRPGKTYDTIDLRFDSQIVTIES